MSVKEKIKEKARDAFNYAVVHRPVMTGGTEIALGGAAVIGAATLGLAPLVGIPMGLAGVAALAFGAARNGIDRANRINEMIAYDQARADEKAAKRQAKKEARQGLTPK